MFLVPTDRKIWIKTLIQKAPEAKTRLPSSVTFVPESAGHWHCRYAEVFRRRSESERRRSLLSDLYSILSLFVNCNAL